MTNDEMFDWLYRLRSNVGVYMPREWNMPITKALDKAIRELKQEPITKNDLAVDCISRQAVIDGINEYFHDEYYQRTSIQDCRDCLIEDVIKDLPPVTPQPQTEHCKNCKWWKDSDGVYRRGIGEESQCPINRKEVYEGNGYCYMFKPHEKRGIRNE